MIIKEVKKKKRKNLFSFNFFLKFYFFSSSIIILFVLVAILKSQTFNITKKKYLDYFSKGGRFEYLYLPIIAIKALKSNFYKIENVNLEITFEDTITIENIRKSSIKSGLLPESSLMPQIKTNISFNDKKFRGDIRLKGDRKIHYESKNKSSYKIELDRNQYILGMKKFSIQKPRARNYIHEWIFHELAGNLDLIKLKYEFVNLSINGDDKGLYVLEEGFGKELIERNERRNGPIFGIDENISFGTKDPVFEIYNKKYWNSDENFFLAGIASQKLRDFFRGKVEINEIFDLEKWAAFFAVMDMSQTYHGAFLQSVKFYYNPLNGLFEPIAFDGHRFKHNYNKYHLNYDNRLLFDFVEKSLEEKSEQFSWIQKFFYKDGKLNQNFYNLYTDNLNKISSESFINKFISKNLQKIEEINSHIYADYFWFDNLTDYGVGLYYFSLDDFFYQASNIQKKLKLQRKIQVLQEDQSKFIIKKFYKNYGFSSVDKVICKNKSNEIIELKINQNLNNFSNTVINLPIKLGGGTKCRQIKLNDEYNKFSILLNIDHINSNYKFKSNKKFDPKLIKKYFIESNNNFYLIADEIEIDQNIYIPKGYKFIVKPGQKITLSNNSFIISNSPWVIGGVGEKTIIKGKKNNLGGGIYIGDTKELSLIQNTEFTYLTGNKNYSNFEFQILGSINFHNTNVHLENINFDNIFSEDAINIFRSKFKISNGIYSNISSDAIDIDFSDGKIENIKFSGIKNDAIDFSGSNAKILNCYFENINDKIISVGERSNVNVSKIKAFNSFIGIASKDSSKVLSKDIVFDEVKIPFAAYQKKEYDYGSLVVKNSKINNFIVESVKDEISQITIDNKKVLLETKR